jgi:hypothetical protein
MSRYPWDNFRERNMGRDCYGRSGFETVSTTVPQQAEYIFTPEVSRTPMMIARGPFVRGCHYPALKKSIDNIRKNLRELKVEIRPNQVWLD